MTITNKKALLIGCNYTSVPQIKLRGCINDIINIKEVLMDSFDYDRSNITQLRDDSTDPNKLPTRANIIKNLINIVNESANLSELWIQYSGHGSQVKIINSKEIDGLDEVIVPIDYQKAGLIVDDEIFNIIKNTKCPTILLFDCCNSGSICDLQYKFDLTNNTFKRSIVEKKEIANPNIFCFSGCKDNQTSADSFNPEQQLGVGAFTDAFIYSLRENHYNVNIMKLYSDICNYVKKGGYTQIPILSSTTANPVYNFTRVNNGVLRTTDIPIVPDVPPIPNTTTIITVVTKPANTPVSNVPVKNIDLNMNFFRKPVNKLGKMF